MKINWKRTYILSNNKLSIHETTQKPQNFTLNEGSYIQNRPYAIYMKLKNRQNLQWQKRHQWWLGTWMAHGDWLRNGTGMMEKLFNLYWGTAYTGTYICQNSNYIHLKLVLLLHVNYTSMKSLKKNSIEWNLHSFPND